MEEPGCGPQRSRAGSTPRAGHRSRCPVTMSNVKAEDDITLVEREMKEFWAELKGVYGTEQLKQTLALRDSCKESLKVLSGEEAARSLHPRVLQAIPRLLRVTEVSCPYREMGQKAERGGPDDR